MFFAAVTVANTLPTGEPTMRAFMHGYVTIYNTEIRDGRRDDKVCQHSQQQPHRAKFPVIVVHRDAVSRQLAAVMFPLISPD